MCALCVCGCVGVWVCVCVCACLGQSEHTFTFIQVVYVYGASNPYLPVACSAVVYMPPSWEGVALWFGVTAFLFCVHSMVRYKQSMHKNVPCAASHIGHTSRVRNGRASEDVFCTGHGLHCSDWIESTICIVRLFSFWATD